MQTRTTAPLRALLVSEELGTAMARSMLVLARSLEEQGHDVVVAALSPATAGDDRDPDDVPIVTPPLEGDAPTRAAWLGAVAASFDPDVVHVHGAEAMAAVAAMPQRASSAVVATLPMRAASGRRASSAAASLAADAMIAPTARAAAQLVRATGCDPTLVRVIPPGVTLDCADGAARHQRAGRMVGVVSDLVPESSVDVFLRAAARLSAVAPDVTYAVVGDGPERLALEDLAERLEIRSRLGFLHERSDVSGILQRLDVLCVPGTSDATPYAALEAMALGTPIVAVNAVGIEEIARPAREALLVDQGDDEAMAAHAAGLLEHRVLARPLAWSARRRVRRRFSVARITALHEELYVECRQAHTREPAPAHAEPLPLAASA